MLGAPGGDGDRAESLLAAIRAAVPRDREVLFCGWARAGLHFDSACDAKCIAPGATGRSGVRCSHRVLCRCCGDTESSAEEHKDMQSCSLHHFQLWRWDPWLIRCPHAYLVKLREQKLLRSSSYYALHVFPYTYSLIPTMEDCVSYHTVLCPTLLYLPYHAIPTHTVPRTIQQYSGKVKQCLCRARCLHRYTLILYAPFRKAVRSGLVAACVCVTNGISDRKIVF